jgi:hypothetical protein
MGSCPHVTLHFPDFFIFTYAPPTGRGQILFSLFLSDRTLDTCPDHFWSIRNVSRPTGTSVSAFGIFGDFFDNFCLKNGLFCPFFCPFSLDAGVLHWAAGILHLPEKNACRVHEFSAGVHKFSAGVHEFSAGVHEFSAGVHEFSACVHEFSAGVHEFSAGVHDVTGQHARSKGAPNGIRQHQRSARKVLFWALSEEPLLGTCDATTGASVRLSYVMLALVSPWSEQICARFLNRPPNE